MNATLATAMIRTNRGQRVLSISGGASSFFSHTTDMIDQSRPSVDASWGRAPDDLDTRRAVARLLSCV